MKMIKLRFGPSRSVTTAHIKSKIILKILHLIIIVISKIIVKIEIGNINKTPSLQLLIIVRFDRLSHRNVIIVDSDTRF